MHCEWEAVLRKMAEKKRVAEAAAARRRMLQQIDEEEEGKQQKQKHLYSGWLNKKSIGKLLMWRK